MIRSGEQSGYILLPVIVVITLVAAIALLMNTESALEGNTAASELDAQQARYVAEAGLNHALWLTQQQGCGPYSDLTDEPLGGDIYSSQLTTDLGSTTAFTINVDQDSWIRSDMPTDNKATDLKLHTRNETLGTERPLLRYDLSPLAAKAQILSATAWFYITNAHAAGPIDIHLTSTDWTETDATWNSMNANMDSTVLATIPSQPVTGIWIPVNLTAQVQAWVNGQPNFGITLNSTVDGVHGQYNSRESANPPYLEVVVGAPPTSPATLKADGTLANGVQRSIKDKDVTLVQHPPGNLFLQLGSDAGEDALLDSFYDLRNYGGANYMQVHDNESDWQQYPLIRFNLNRLPQAAVVHSARLELRLLSLNAPGKAMIHQVTRDWVEGTKSGGGTADGANWSTYDGTNPWASAGGDINTAVVAETTINGGETWVSWDITSLVERWLSGDSNYGLLIKPDSALNQAKFASKEDSDQALHPKLSVTYTCACGEVCMTPQGSGKLLMVVVSPTVLVAEDQKAKDLFESWGYTVSVISESANQTTYDAAVAANDVVFISETVNSNSVGTKLVNAPIGVVSQDGDYNPDLGLASGAALKVGSGIDIVSTDHYITRPFAVGTHRIYAADMEQAIVSGSLTADQQTLAEIGGDGSLVVLDKGDAMEGGGTAAGRRVILPLGTRYRFNWDYLNANGRLLVQRALEWGLGPGNKVAGKLLLVVANAGSPLTSESDRRSLIESWGYEVTLISDDAPQADYDTALADVDVVYVTGSGSSTEVGTKLTAATVGVLSEDIGLVDELGIAEPVFVKRNSQHINVIDNTHYVTSGFSLGALQLYSYLPEIWTVTGSLAPGLQILGETQDGVSTFPPGLAFLETGAELYGGGFAAGRRVQMPWSEGSFDINALNADGRTIFRRAIEWGAGAEIPDLSNELLFVVADASALTGAETAKQSLIESWGYTVNLIDDADSLTNFAAAFAANGVIYISGEVSDSALNSKLTKTTLGVVNEQISLHDELLLSTSAGTNDFNRVFVINNTHYITEGINTGWHTIATVNQPLNALEGTLAPGMTNLAEVWISGATYDFGLAVVDTGGQLNGGEIAAGRRAQLPWGTASFDFSTLNANGQNLMQRAIEWASGAEIDLSPIAHWKLDETTGPTAVDSEGGNDGTWTNDPNPAPAVVDGGLDFDGSNDYVDAGSFDVNGSGITMMAWFNAEAIATDDGRFISKASGPNATDAWWQLSTTDSGSNRYLRMRIKAGGTTTTFADSSVNLTTAQWYFAVGTYDSATGDMRLYLDGAEVANGSHAVGGAIDTDAAVPVAIGANGTAERFFNGILDDVRVYDYALSASEISDLYAANAPLGPSSYTEMYQSWSATADDTWQTVDLGAFGVPANAVVEVAIVNSKDKNERWGGVRAVGSSLDRIMQLHESEGGGVDALTMHVQADASSQIQHFSEKKGELTFILLGYWTGASYTELMEPFSADASNSWVDENLADDGLGPNQIAEIVMLNTNQGAERLAGVRPSGASYQRRFNLHEAEAGGVDAVTMMVSTDATSIAEVFATNAGDVDFYVVGFWSTPPGTYVATGGVHGQATAASTWEQADLAGFGVPADSVAQFVISSEVLNFSRELGVREVGSGELRVIDLHKAEAGGSENASLHVNVDSAANIEWYSASGTSDRYFYPVGWWVLSP